MSGKVKILYVDDEIINLMNFSIVFEDKYEVFTAVSAAEALLLLESNPIEIIFSDHRMPVMTGSDFFVSISDRFPSIPKVIITGYLKNHEVEEITRTGVIQKVINKPYMEEDVEETIRELVR